MKDYIERDELVSYFKEIATKTLRDGSVQCVLGAGVIAHMIVEIKEFPAADVRPVVRGKWIGYPGCLKYQNAYSDDHIVCSACEECFSILDNDCERFNFCPNCGSLNKEDET